MGDSSVVPDRRKTVTVKDTTPLTPLTCPNSLKSFQTTAAATETGFRSRNKINKYSVNSFAIAEKCGLCRAV
jgi:hypothetical protein